MKLRTAIFDGDGVAREHLAAMVAKEPDLLVVGAAGDGAAALQLIRRERPDLAILEAQLPKKSGFDVIEALAPDDRPLVVILGAVEQHAVRAFEVGALDFLLKPLTEERLRLALARAREEMRRRHSAGLSQRVEALLAYARELELGIPSGALGGSVSTPPPEYADRIVVKSGGDLHFIKTADVLWIEAQGDFVRVQTSEQPQLVRETLQSMERKLDASRFIRIHRSFLVNLAHIKRVAPALYGDHTVFMTDGSKLRLSRNYRSRLRNFIERPSA